MIGQEMIELLIGFESLLRERQQKYSELYEAVRDQLRDGAKVEAGSHTVELDAGGRYLVIDGQPQVDFAPAGPA